MIFRDETQNEWKLDLTISAVKRVKAHVDGVDLLQAQSREGEKPSLLARLATDVELLCDVIYAICKPQADTKSISAAEFGELLCGDVIAGAHAAFWEELRLFFLGLGQPATVEAINQMVIGQRRTQELGAEFLKTIDAKAMIDRSLGETFTNLQASLGLKPTT